MSARIIDGKAIAARVRAETGREVAEFNRRAHLLYFSAGTAETTLWTNAIAMRDALTKAGVNSVFYDSPGTAHEWQTWRRSLHDFAPRLFVPASRSR